MFRSGYAPTLTGRPTEKKGINTTDYSHLYNRLIPLYLTTWILVLNLSLAFQPAFPTMKM
jgi:hypothetical protein